eukprot:scaffold17337_cov98-Isochrysis_galbana.AAC.2
MRLHPHAPSRPPALATAHTQPPTAGEKVAIPPPSPQTHAYKGAQDAQLPRPRAQLMNSVASRLALVRMAAASGPAAAGTRNRRRAGPSRWTRPCPTPEAWGEREWGANGRTPEVWGGCEGGVGRV